MGNMTLTYLPVAWKRSNWHDGMGNWQASSDKQWHNGCPYCYDSLLPRISDDSEESWKGKKHRVLQHGWQRTRLHSWDCGMRWVVAYTSIYDTLVHHDCQISLHNGALCYDPHALVLPLQSPSQRKTKSLFLNIYWVIFRYWIDSRQDC
jgi:hypothetical protein